MIKKRILRGSSEGPHLLVTGGVHGDEFEPMVAIRRLIRRFEIEPFAGQLTLVPVVNEPAFLRGTRCAEDDLDLARQCPGDVDGSITQQLAAAVSEIIRSADYYIDLHTGGNIMDVWPLTGYKLVDDKGVLERQREMARVFNLPFVWGTDAKLEGRTLSVARDAGIPTIYAEYLGSGRCETAGVEAYFEGCLNVMGWLGMISRQQPPSLVELEIEDHRDGAGHMQVRNLAPATGFFEPAVKLGDRIQAGQLLGVVSDPLGDDTHEVVAKESGVVIVLRTFSRVHQGESLGVVAETNPSG